MDRNFGRWQDFFACIGLQGQIGEKSGGVAVGGGGERKREWEMVMKELIASSGF